MNWITVYPKKYAHGFVVLCFVVVIQSFIMNSHEVFIHIHQGCFAGTGAIVRLPQCQWNKPDGYGKISQCITTTKHSKAKTVCIFLGIYCTTLFMLWIIHSVSLCIAVLVLSRRMYSLSIFSHIYHGSRARWFNWGRPLKTETMVCRVKNFVTESDHLSIDIWMHKHGCL